MIVGNHHQMHARDDPILRSFRCAGLSADRDFQTPGDIFNTKPEPAVNATKRGSRPQAISALRPFGSDTVIARSIAEYHAGYEPGLTVGVVGRSALGKTLAKLIRAIPGKDTH